MLNKLEKPLQSSERKFNTLHSRVLVIIPAYNEEESIGLVIQDIKRCAPYADILVIDDGSSDNTGSVAQNLGASVLDLPYNLGIGGAVRAGYALAEEMGYPWIVRLDGDGQHEPADIVNLLDPVVQGKADAVFGSRFRGNLNSYQPGVSRRIGIWIYGLLVSLIIRQRIHDATSGFWCINRKTVRYFKHNFPQDYPEVESHIVLHKAGLSQLEVPARMHPRNEGQSSIGFIRSFYYAFKVILAVLFRAVQKVKQIPEEETFVFKNPDNSHSG